MSSTGYHLFNKINVVSVAYRDKRIIDTVTDLYDKSVYKENLIIRCGIQDSHRYDFNIDGLEKYNSYMSWDDWRGFAKIRSELFHGISDINNFILFINPGTIFSEGWDEKILKYYSDLVNQSGKDLVAIGLEDNKYDSSAFFVRKKTIAQYGYPEYLKLQGENEEVSLRLNASNVSIYAGIENFLETKKLKKWDHIPFSTSHNYDKVIELYQKGYNEYVSLTSLNWKSYAYVNIPRNIFDQLNDVKYDKSKLPTLKHGRFYDHNNQIE